MSSIIVPPDLESLTERIIGCGIAVHKELGPGLLESVYRECLCIEFELAGLRFASEKSVPIIYRDRPVSTHLRIDVLVEEKVVVEIKAVDKLHPIYTAQVITYLKLARCPAGLLMNFNAISLRNGLQRVAVISSMRHVRPGVYRLRGAPGGSGVPSWPPRLHSWRAAVAGRPHRRPHHASLVPRSDRPPGPPHLPPTPDPMARSHP
jgi:GxxExxY protein